VRVFRKREGQVRNPQGPKLKGFILLLIGAILSYKGLWKLRFEINNGWFSGLEAITGAASIFFGLLIVLNMA
jgi:hypothetical protein